jgi:hypothetical protein
MAALERDVDPVPRPYAGRVQHRLIDALETVG